MLFDEGMEEEEDRGGHWPYYRSTGGLRWESPELRCDRDNPRHELVDRLVI
jgi:hypothetical protein